MEPFSALLAICEGNSPVPGEFPAQRPVTRSFDVFFDLRPNKRLNKQSWGWWFETPSRSLWRHCNARLPVHEVCREFGKWWMCKTVQTLSFTLNTCRSRVHGCYARHCVFIHWGSKVFYLSLLLRLRLISELACYSCSIFKWYLLGFEGNYVK